MEKRRFVRHPASIQIAGSSDGKAYIPGIMFNISNGGMAFNLPESFKPGQVLSVKISYRNAEHALPSRVVS